jgi:hypothetical protein
MQIELQFMPVSTELGTSILENDDPVVGWKWCKHSIGRPDFGPGKHASAVFPDVDDLQITITPDWPATECVGGGPSLCKEKQSSELSLRATGHALLHGLWGLRVAEATFDVLSAPNLPDDPLTTACRFCGETGSLAA